MEVPSVKKVLSGKAIAQFHLKLDGIPATKKETSYKKLMNRIDTLLAQTKNERTKEVLLELKTHVQSRIDSLDTR